VTERIIILVLTTGSPFPVHVVDQDAVTALGDGLATGKVGYKSAFVIDTAQEAFTSDVNVRIKCEF